MRDYPMHCRASLASSPRWRQHSPVVKSKTISRHYQMSPGMRDHAKVRTTDIESPILSHVCFLHVPSALAKVLNESVTKFIEHFFVLIYLIFQQHTRNITPISFLKCSFLLVSVTTFSCFLLMHWPLLVIILIWFQSLVPVLFHFPCTLSLVI